MGGASARHHRPLRAPTVRAAARPGSSGRQPAERGALPVHAEDVGKVRGVAVELREVRGRGPQERLHESRLSRDRQHSDPALVPDDLGRAAEELRGRAALRFGQVPQDGKSLRTTTGHREEAFLMNTLERVHR